MSYAAADGDWAKRLSEELGKVGLQVWDAGRDLYPGDNIALRSGEALAEADALVVLLSPAAGKSPSLESEIQYAITAPRFEHRLFPVLIRATRDVPWILRRIQTLSGNPTTVARQIAERLDALAQP